MIGQPVASLAFNGACPTSSNPTECNIDAAPAEITMPQKVLEDADATSLLQVQSRLTVKAQEQLPKTRWESFKGMDSNSGHNAEVWNSYTDLDKVKAHCSKKKYGGFTIWYGMVFFRSVTAEKLRESKINSTPSTLYIRSDDERDGGNKDQDDTPQPLENEKERNQQILDAHNKYRCMHGVPPLKWNIAIEANAKSWASETGGKMKHSSWEARKKTNGFKMLGENLAWGSNQVTSATCAEFVKGWYSEIKNTDGSKGLVTGFGMSTGHYTQVVWKGSTDLGCAVEKHLLVCQYGEAGNMGGAYEQNVFALKKTESECAV